LVRIPIAFMLSILGPVQDRPEIGPRTGIVTKNTS
jgi:hypothetical protein